MTDDSIDYEYYELRRVTIHKPRPGAVRLATAAVHTCALCGATINGMGGPGDGDICIPCGDLLKSGKAVGAIVWSKQEDNP